ncbi:cytochrome C [Sphingomonas sp. ABOLD]|uniref:Cytochrome c2 n=2 Tax=Sphingomonas TaxID=13687 RepID=A0A7X5Y3E3_9SPHN|nr:MULTISPECIES: c-type cytochrome [Sphingomonas]NJB99928.1 cytochrome c2 [Sphingomonas trueperi]RSV40375.1 cytochrome C [Sphingomonas sp. ABOLD]
MPFELRFVYAMTAFAALAGVLSVAGIYYQDSAQSRTHAEAMTGGSVAAGKAAIGRYNCGACHRIPGIGAATGVAGPALNGIATRSFIAGTLPNDSPNLQRWLQHPQQVVPGNAMPEQGVTPRDARDIAAYLYTLRR